MKTTKLIAIGLLFMFIFAACSFRNNKNASAGAGKGRLTIVTSFYPMYIFALNIAKDVNGVEVLNMTQPQTGCLHDYQLSPADMKTLESANIFIINGAGLESFMNKARSQMKNLKIIDASKGLELLKQDELAGDGEKSGRHTDESGTQSYNPHVWVSISGAISQVSNIGEGLARLDPGNAQKYRTNTKAYIDKLEALKEKMHMELAGLKNKSIVTFHEAFPYFAKEFGLKVEAVVEQQAGTEPSSWELTEIIDTIRKTGVSTLFTEPQYSSRIAGTIARETGAKVYTLDPVVTGPKNAKPGDYIKKMEANLIVLKKALN